MSKGRSTGPGRIKVQQFDIESPYFQELPCKSASLENYNIDGDELKPEHAAWLDEYLVPFAAKNGKTMVRLDGFFLPVSCL